MKKTYLMAASLLLGTASMAQSMKSVVLSKEDNSVAVSHARPVSSDDRAIVLWSDDCSNAANWTFTNTSTPVLDWSIEMSPGSIPVTALSPMNSATAANGYLFINSDGITGNTDGDNTPTIVDATTNTTIDLTGEPNVRLRFSHNYRWWQEDRIVRVSGDNGATWTDFVITDNTGYDLGYGSGLQNSGNPQIENFDISAIAGGSNQVKIQFHYNDNDFWGWYWAVDDVEIIRTEDNDIKVEQAFFGSVGATGTFYDYHMIPTTQVAPITFSANVTNIGLVDQPNVALNVDVNTGAMTLTSAGVMSVVGATDSIVTTTAYTPAATLGTSTFDITITEDLVDADPTNNMINSESVEVTTYTYARDNGTEMGSFGNYSGHAGQAVSLGNVMSVFADGQVGALDIKITLTAANEGGVMYGAVYVYNSATDTYDWLGQTVDYTVTAADLDQWIKLPIVGGPVTFTTGQELLIVAGGYGDDVRFASAQDALPLSVLGFDDQGGLFNLTGASVMMIRMDMRSFVGTDEAEDFNTSVNAYPNPANNNVNINYSVAQTSNVSVKITTITGQVVYTNNLGNVTAGNYTEKINIESMANGVYFYTLNVDGKNITKKLVISKK